MLFSKLKQIFLPDILFYIYDDKNVCIYVQYVQSTSCAVGLKTKITNNI